ncbi:MAG: hypothetical protein ACLR8Y_15450 [Alistipes indistinctus]
MIDLYIDGKRLDTDQQTDAAITLSIGSVEDPSQSLTAFSKSIEVPATARNKEIQLQFADQLHGGRVVQQRLKPGPTGGRGREVVMTGTAQITKVTVKQPAECLIRNEPDRRGLRMGERPPKRKLNETDGLGSWVLLCRHDRKPVGIQWRGFICFRSTGDSTCAGSATRTQTRRGGTERNVCSPALYHAGRLPAFLQRTAAHGEDHRPVRVLDPFGFL